LIVGKVDLDLLSLFPQKDARIMRGMERNVKLSIIKNVGERESGERTSSLLLGMKETIYRFPPNMTVIAFYTRNYIPRMEISG
jgi:hypothetical protein